MQSIMKLDVAGNAASDAIDEDPQQELPPGLRTYKENALQASLERLDEKLDDLKFQAFERAVEMGSPTAQRMQQARAAPKVWDAPVPNNNSKIIAPSAFANMPTATNCTAPYSVLPSSSNRDGTIKRRTRQKGK